MAVTTVQSKRKHRGESGGDLEYVTWEDGDLNNATYVTLVDWRPWTSTTLGAKVFVNNGGTNGVDFRLMTRTSSRMNGEQIATKSATVAASATEAPQTLYSDNLTDGMEIMVEAKLSAGAGDGAGRLEMIGKG